MLFWSHSDEQPLTGVWLHRRHQQLRPRDSSGGTKWSCDRRCKRPGARTFPDLSPALIPRRLNIGPRASPVMSQRWWKYACRLIGQALKMGTQFFFTFVRFIVYKEEHIYFPAVIIDIQVLSKNVQRQNLIKVRNKWKIPKKLPWLVLLCHYLKLSE